MHLPKNKCDIFNKPSNNMTVFVLLGIGKFVFRAMIVDWAIRIALIFMGLTIFAKAIVPKGKKTNHQKIEIDYLVNAISKHETKMDPLCGNCVINRWDYYQEDKRFCH